MWNKIDDSVLYQKSEDFAVRIINLYKHLTQDKKEYVISKQLLRSGTSIGANIAEAEVSRSKKDFFNKIYIAFKEAAESRYWLKLLVRTNYLTTKEFNSLIDDLTEIFQIMNRILITMKRKYDI